MKAIQQNKSQPGFTIVELLIVIVIIGILATITIVAFNGIQNRARASEASSALSQAVKKIKVWQVDNSDQTPIDLATAGVTNSTSVTYQYKPGTNGSYCITATSGSVSYKVTESTQPNSGGCAGHGTGGVEPITNLATGGRGTAFQHTAGTFGFRSDRYTADQDYSLLTGISTPVPDLSTAVRTTWKTTATDSRGFQIGQNTDITITSGYPIAANKTYMVSVYGRGNFSSNMAAMLMCRLRDSSGATLATLLNNIVITSSWQRYSLQLNTPSNTSTLVCRLTLSGTSPAVTIGNSLDATGLMLTEGSSLYNYADGNSQGWDWNSAPNNSTSSGSPL